MQKAVQTRDLARRFGNQWALSHINLDVEMGERILIIGENGSGKTTLLRIISGFLQPSRGKIEVFGKKELGVDDQLRIGFLSHEDGLYQDLTATQNLMLVASILKKPFSKVILEQVGLTETNKPVRQFSAGMKRRLAYAKLLLKAPDLIILDEPYTQLDPAGADFVDKYLSEAHNEGKTIIIASHQVERASKQCDKGVLIAAGMPIWTGSAQLAQKAWLKANP